MATYIVKPGDNLSKIGTQFGVPYQQITGYKSGNPNLIYPGEVLTIPDKPQAPTSPAPTTAAPTTVAPATATSVPTAPAPTVPVSSATPAVATPTSTGLPDEQTLINAMTQKGHTPETAKAAIAGRGIADLAREYLGYNAPSAGGTGTGFTGLTNQPTIDLPKLYQNLYQSSGISDKETQLTTKERQYLEAKGKISDNPFLSAPTMDKRLKRLQSIYDTETAPLRNEIAMKKADVETQLNLQLKQFDIQSQQAKQALDQFNMLLGAGALSGASGEDIANITRATGLSSSLIQSAIDAQKKKGVKTSSVSFDDGVNQGFVVYNPDTGEIISKQIVSASKPKAVTETDKTTTLQSQFITAIESKKNSYGHIGPQDWQGALTSWISRGGSRKDFISLFSQYTDPNRGDFQEAYGFPLEDR